MNVRDLAVLAEARELTRGMDRDQFLAWWFSPYTRSSLRFDLCFAVGEITGKHWASFSPDSVHAYLNELAGE